MRASFHKFSNPRKLHSVTGNGFINKEILVLKVKLRVDKNVSCLFLL